MSKIVELYAAFEGTSITLSLTSFNNVTVNARGLSRLPDSLSTAQLPTRVLLPFGGQTGTNRLEIPPQEYGKVRWQITDLMLWRPVAQDIGMRSAGLPLVQYQAAYCNLLLSLNSEIEDDFLVEACDITPGIFEYPTGSGTWYFGVECVATVQELLL